MKSEMDIVKSMKQVTVNIKIKRMAEFRIREWIGLKLIWLATKVWNCNLQVDEEITSDKRIDLVEMKK